MAPWLYIPWCTLCMTRLRAQTPCSIDTKVDLLLGPPSQSLSRPDFGYIPLPSVLIARKIIPICMAFDPCSLNTKNLGARNLSSQVALPHPVPRPILQQLHARRCLFCTILLQSQRGDPSRSSALIRATTAWIHLLTVVIISNHSFTIIRIS